ncbi:DNA-binding protein [Haemophilus influenzae biotype aegyptius]|uniref:helix-turn-helix domain-containing protein n=1 Tax=Haemophilus influenzae TaxID=727 RepID=UPI00110A4E40|nr:helix-turn-helix domain-containing protein [Haemophilus influenzae]QEQ61214.1 helix-turn-helix domain-containing protein [Haemophilus influenzae biotype aegyptius]QEQ63292.1 helix-turn-helix domain-containing protein [Haemophilus influenzae biotype aegyptius]QEQ64774.1 helix-turn-helix domain-containing protein [Haemophilus influenzae biotype aegyptius]TMQ38651.1 DNA-binding protein [Haemophilus influenzae biotype aegyptius]TMQ39847.1 DNA-binding protein [Haemophilus influenzae biotype aegy
MSMRLMVQAMNCKVGNPARKLVLLKLADNANDDGICFPSYQYIADKCEMTRRSAISHIECLIKMGLVSKKERKNKDGSISNLYFLHLEQGSENFALGGENISLGSEKFALGGSENISPITSHSLEPVNEPKKTTQKSESEMLLERFGITGQLAKDFIAHRKTKRGAISETQLSRLQKQADKAGISICEVVEICIERNWQGFNAAWDWRDEKLRPNSPHLGQSHPNKPKFDDTQTGWSAGMNFTVDGTQWQIP